MSSNNPLPQAPPLLSTISPLAIATAFLKQYYLILSTNNSFIHKFYKGDSQISFSPNCNTPAVSQAFSALTNVEEKFAWAANSRVDFANGSIDAQESVGGGILVVVTGEMFLEGTNDKKLFVQTFFLKDDGKSRGAPKRNFFVFNDVFRFLERDIESDVSNVHEEVAGTVDDVLPTEKRSLKVQTEDVAQLVEAVETVKINGEGGRTIVETIVNPESESKPGLHGNNGVDKPSKVDELEENYLAVNAEVDSAPESSDAVVADSLQVDKPNEQPTQKTVNIPEPDVSKSAQKSKPPGSWASLVAGSSPKTSTQADASSPPPTSKPSPKVESEQESTNPVTTVSTNTNTSRPKRPPRPQESEPESTNTSGNTGVRSSGYGSKGSSSLYIKNVGDGINESDLRDLFKEYSFKIVNVSFYPSRGYAFVDFADANAVNSIMKENRQTFHIHGRDIEVEKKSSDRRRTGGNSGGTGNGSRGGSGNAGNQRSSPKGQRQRSHSGRRLNGGSDGDKRGRKGRSGGGDKRKDSNTNTGGGASGS